MKPKVKKPKKMNMGGVITKILMQQKLLIERTMVVRLKAHSNGKPRGNPKGKRLK